MKKINFTPQDWTQFDGLPLRPGIEFFKIFDQVRPEALRHVKRISIPESLMCFDKLSWIRYGNI